MNKINIVREIKNNKKKNLNNNEMMRETGWNNRFYLGKITDYNNNTIKKNKTCNNNFINNKNLNSALYNYNYNNSNQYLSNKPFHNLDTNLAFLRSQIKNRKKNYPNTSRSQNHSKITKNFHGNKTNNLNNNNFFTKNYNLNNNNFNNNNNNYLNDDNYEDNNNYYSGLDTEENSVFTNMSQSEIETYLNILWDDLGVLP